MPEGPDFSCAGIQGMEVQESRGGVPGRKGSRGQGTRGPGVGGGITEGRGYWLPELQPKSVQVGPYPSLAPRPRCRLWRQTPACICSAPAACARSSSAAPWCPPAQKSPPRLNPSSLACLERAPEPRTATALRLQCGGETLLPRFLDPHLPEPASSSAFPLSTPLPSVPAHTNTAHTNTAPGTSPSHL